MYSACDTDFNIDRHLIPFLQEVPFFAELSRQLHKTPTRSMPTAAVSFNIETDEIALYFNPDFFESMTNWQIRGVILHEFYHLVFGHLNARRKRPSRLWNVACDLAINSIIVKNAKDSMPRDAEPGDSPLPKVALIPGQFPVHPDGRELSKEEKEGSKLGVIIATLPHMQASEFYFNELLKASGNSGKGKRGKPTSGKPGDGQGTPDDDEDDDDEFDDDFVDSMDDHSPWDSVPEEYREYVEGRVKAMVEKAVKYADSHPSGWGNMPQEIVADIRRSISQVVNWRSVLRQFVGTMIRGKRSTTIRRINKRYPYIAPGIKRGYEAHLLVAMDQSGSVPDDMVAEFYGELRGLTKRVSIDYVIFDAECGPVVRWDRGKPPSWKRTMSGGTSFDAPTALFNKPENRGRWDGLLICTDGGCSKPGPARKKRGWVLGKGQKLLFDSEEIQISVSKDAPMKGAWR